MKGYCRAPCYTWQHYWLGPGHDSNVTVSKSFSAPVPDTVKDVVGPRPDPSNLVSLCLTLIYGRVCCKYCSSFCLFTWKLEYSANNRENLVEILSKVQSSLNKIMFQRLNNMKILCKKWTCQFSVANFLAQLLLA